jgi:DNA-binding NarL/FixJ family response regulator
MSVRVILADDYPAGIEAAVCFLSVDPDVEIVGRALSGLEALEQITLLRPDLVLVDLAMPGTNGLEVTRLTKTQPKPPHVIILTLYDHPEYRTSAAVAGADGFISKSELTTQLLPFIHCRCMNSDPESI